MYPSNPLVKGMNPFLPSYKSTVEQTSFFNISMATSLGEEKLWIPISYQPLKNDLAYDLARFSDIYIYIYIELT